MGTRNVIGIFNEVWAGTGDRSEIGDFNAGFGFEYQVDTAPDRRHMNDVLAKCTAVGVDINKYGAGLPWNASPVYEVGAYVTASDNKLYRALLQNSAKDPVSNPTEWRRFTGVEIAYAVTQSPDGDLRTFDADDYSNDEMARVLATLIADLT